MEESREEMILRLRGLVYKIANSIGERHGSSFDDLVQDGWLGAIAAVDRYDPDNLAGAALGTYASHRIRGAILDGLRSRDYLSNHHRRDVIAGRRPVAPSPMSLDEVVVVDGGEGDTLADTLIDIAASEAMDIRLGEIDMDSLLALLPTRQSAVIRGIYWGGYSLVNISQVMGVTDSRVSQLRAKAESTLRESLVTDVTV